MAPDSFYRVEIWGFGRCVPPVYTFTLKESFCNTTGMFRVIILLKSKLSVGELSSNKRSNPAVKIRVYLGPSIVPSNITTLIAPCFDIPPQM